jgi:hypothetical protein
MPRRSVAVEFYSMGTFHEGFEDRIESAPAGTRATATGIRISIRKGFNGWPARAEHPSKHARRIQPSGLERNTLTNEKWSNPKKER